MSIPALLSADLPEPSQISKVAPWDLDFRQISKGSGTTSVSVRSGQLVTAMSLRMQCKVHQSGESPRDFVTVGVPKPGSLKTWFGRDVPHYSMYCFGSGQEFDCVSETLFDGVTTSINKDNLARAAQDFGLQDVSALHSTGLIDLSRLPGPASDYSRSVARFLMDDASAFDPNLEDEICLAIVMAHGQALKVEPELSQRVRDKALRRALEIIEESLLDPPTIRELCVLSEASLMTLNRAFLERFGVGPKKYLSNLLLNRSRSDLLAAGEGTKVADIANKWGFWHMGQFARDYRALFSRLPSEDLRS